jgi:glycine betaine/proline transport system ATP-binding protein
MEHHGVSGVFVVDKEGALLGHISADQASELARRGERDVAGNMERDILKVYEDTALYDVLEMMARTKLPVAVVDERCRLRGVLVRGAVLAGLAGERRVPEEEARR